MRRLLFFVLSPLTLLALACGLVAGPVYCPPGFYQGVFYPHGYYVQQPTFQERFVIAEKIDVAAVNPIYSTALTPQYFDSNLQLELTASVNGLRAEVRQLRSAPAASVPAQPPVTTLPPKPEKEDHGPLDGGAVIAARCALCHQAGNQSPDTRFTLLDNKGNLVPLTDKQCLEIIDRIYASEMPPPNNTKGVPQLSPAERTAIVLRIRKK